MVGAQTCFSGIGGSYVTIVAFEEHLGQSVFRLNEVGA